MPISRHSHTMTMMNEGEAMVAGKHVSVIRKYFIANNSYTPLAPVPQPATLPNLALALGVGKVVWVGGQGH